MDNNIPEMPSRNSFERNKLPIIGFISMIAGPGILMFAGFLTDIFGPFPVIIANIIVWTAILLPGIGVVISIISLVKWRKTGKLGCALAIVTCIMCNPLFYLYYFIICLFSINALAGIAWSM